MLPLGCHRTKTVGKEMARHSQGCLKIYSTERGVLTVARFCHVFPCELRGPAWAVGSYSISKSVGGTSQNIIFKTLRLIGHPAL